MRVRRHGLLDFSASAYLTLIEVCGDIFYKSIKYRAK
jgi:hypothetical protein